MTLSEPSDFGLAQWAERDMLWSMTLQTEFSGAGDAGSERVSPRKMTLLAFSGGYAGPVYHPPSLKLRLDQRQEPE